jgi:hypothetical protein
MCKAAKPVPEYMTTPANEQALFGVFQIGVDRVPLAVEFNPH